MATDKELMEDDTSALESSFGELFNIHARSILSYAWALTANYEDALDVVQETFLIAWRKKNSLFQASDSALPWLLVTTRNVARNLQRRNLRRHSAPLETAEPLAANSTSSGAVEELAAIIEAIDALPSMDAALCRLCIIDGYSYAEAAAALGITENAAGKRLQRVRTYLRATRTAYRKAEQ